MRASLRTCCLDGLLLSVPRLRALSVGVLTGSLGCPPAAASEDEPSCPSENLPCFLLRFALPGGLEHGLCAGQGRGLSPLTRCPRDQK